MSGFLCVAVFIQSRSIRVFFKTLLSHQVSFSGALQITFSRGAQVVGSVAVVVVDRLVDQLRDALAVLLQSVQRVLNRLVDGLLDVLAHLFDLIGATGRLSAPE